MDGLYIRQSTEDINRTNTDSLSGKLEEFC